MSSVLLEVALKRCPFCGSDDLEIDSFFNSGEPDHPGGRKWVECLGCETSGPMAEREEEAVRKWNERVG